MHDPPYLIELYDLVETLDAEHDPDRAVLRAGEDGPEIVLGWDDYQENGEDLDERSGEEDPREGRDDGR